MTNPDIAYIPQQRPRLIPVLLLKEDGLLYKTQQFKKPKYIGDPRIVVKIFNDKGADELVLLDIDATRNNRAPNFQLIEEIASEAFMPVGYGGGIKTAEQAKQIFSLGIEKIILNSAAIGKPELIASIGAHSGGQSVVVSIDAKKDLFGRLRAYTDGGKKNTGMHPVEVAKMALEAGAGEIIINSITREGMFCGYDEDLCRMVSEAVSIPVIACGGAKNVEDCISIITNSGASAAAAGSIFVFQGPHRAVLIKFPSDESLENHFRVQK